MNTKKEIKIGLGTVIFIAILIIILLLIITGLFYYYIIKGNDNGNTVANLNVIDEKFINTNELKNDNSITTDLNSVESIGVRYNKNFEDMLVEYILNSIETYTNNGNIIKSTDGYILADKLTIEEFNSNRLIYKEKIKNMLENTDIFGNAFIEDNKEACTYNLEKILNNLGIGTHMGLGTGKTDDLGNKTYILGQTEIDTTDPDSEN